MSQRHTFTRSASFLTSVLGRPRLCPWKRHYTATRPSEYDTSALFQGIQKGDRPALARGITLVESTRSEHRLQAQQLLSLVLKSDSYRDAKTFRIGLSGPPGAGKSTFIESFGMYLVDQGHKVSVLAVDPSSTRTGGSILGDKTRMVELSRTDGAYVRPSPTRGTLGGVARNTLEGIILCEGAGYNIVLVETVGVGQSETMVSEMVDAFVLLVPPGGGDELQGIKKGIVELADLVIVNKADGDLAAEARRAAIEYTSALKLLRPRTKAWNPKVQLVSSVEKKGIDEVWKSLSSYREAMEKAGLLQEKRADQRRMWMWRQVTDDLLSELKSDDKVQALAKKLEELVLKGETTPSDAAHRIVRSFFENMTSSVQR